MPTTPQDRKPRKVTKFTFDIAGKPYTLPLASKAAAKVSGRALRDAALNGQEGQIALGFQMLDACGADQATIDAILDLPGPRTVQIIEDWLALGDGDGANLPE